MKANRLSTKKKDSKMNHRDVQIAEQLESNRETILAAATEAVTEAASAAAETDGKLKGEYILSFFICQKIKK
jgi:hypothetical protein